MSISPDTERRGADDERYISGASEKIREYIEKKYKSPALHIIAQTGDLDRIRKWSLAQLSYPEARTDDCDPDDIGRLGRLIDKIEKYQSAVADE